MLNYIDTIQKIRFLIMERFQIAADKLTEEATLQSLGIDSLHIVEVVIDLEAELGVVIDVTAVHPRMALGHLATVICASPPIRG